MEEDIHHIQNQTFTDRHIQLPISFLDTQLHNILLVFQEYLMPVCTVLEVTLRKLLQL